MTEPKSVVLPITPRGSGREFNKLSNPTEGRLLSKTAIFSDTTPSAQFVQV